MASIKNSGYEKAYSNIMGMDNSPSEPFAINRIRVYPCDNIFRFRMKVAGAYNWIDRIMLWRKSTSSLSDKGIEHA